MQFKILAFCFITGLVAALPSTANADDTDLFGKPLQFPQHRFLPDPDTTCEQCMDEIKNGYDRIINSEDPDWKEYIAWCEKQCSEEGRSNSYCVQREDDFLGSIYAY